MLGTRYDVDDRVKHQYSRQFPHVCPKERKAQKYIVNVILFIKAKHNCPNKQMVFRTTHEDAGWDTCKTRHIFCLSPIFYDSKNHFYKKIS